MTWSVLRHWRRRTQLGCDGDWIAQFVGREIRSLDYIEGVGQPLGNQSFQKFLNRFGGWPTVTFTEVGAASRSREFSMETALPPGRTGTDLDGYSSPAPPDIAGGFPSRFSFIGGAGTLSGGSCFFEPGAARAADLGAASYRPN